MISYNFLVLPALLLILHCCLTLANTEIVNFAATQETDVHINAVDVWPVLRPGANEIQLKVQPAALGTTLDQVCEPPTWLVPKTKETQLPCPYEVWTVLDLEHEEWASYSKFTLRISWPASSPVDFKIDLYSPEDLRDRFSGHSVVVNADDSSIDTISNVPSTRRKYARIRLTDTGIRIPSSDPVDSPLVPFNVIVEPLHFGVLPTSVVPIVLFLLAVMSIAVLAVPYIYRHFEVLAKSAPEHINYKKED